MFKLKKIPAIKMVIIMALCLLITSVSALADSHGKDNPDPYLKADESWISISGTAVDVKKGAFWLDYGEGLVMIEMDDWDWYDEARAILEGDKVIVYGEIDDDLYETTSIEASSVYVENLGTYFYASSADEELTDDYDYWIAPAPIIVGQTVVRGTVTSVSGREFTIDTGLKKLKVDTISMPYNPLDDKGYQKVDKGDYVRVSGNMDYDFWEKKELMADYIVTLIDD